MLDAMSSTPANGCLAARAGSAGGGGIGCPVLGGVVGIASTVMIVSALTSDFVSAPPATPLVCAELSGRGISGAVLSSATAGEPPKAVRSSEASSPAVLWRSSRSFEIARLIALLNADGTLGIDLT